ncbi:MAG TPA: flagellar hook-length control protein FliK, partial [Jatrophihabitans sp.]|nr:flagellar hook-length control protein FliK [Jatrophihabitans sp.]
APAPVATATAAAPAAAPPTPTPAAPPQPALHAALGTAVTRARHDGSHTVEVALHPADLGQVQVHATLRHGTLSVTVSCADPAARDAVQAALPDLHRQLAAPDALTVRLDPAPDASAAVPASVNADASATTGGGAGGRSAGGQGQPAPATPGSSAGPDPSPRDPGPTSSRGPARALDRGLDRWM